MIDCNNILELVNQFEQEILPKEQWTHEAHLAVGCFYVFTYGKDVALEKIRVNIKKYNVATGGENTTSSGYHETITVFWIWNIQRFLEKQPNKELKAFVKSFISSSFADKNQPFIYYSKDLLLSTQARLKFEFPDLLPFV